MVNYTLDTTMEILGAMWTVKMCSEEEEPLLKDLGGFTDWTERLICIHNVPPENELGNPLENIKRNIRHEVIHAFMFESGLAENWEHKDMGQEEQTVDWIAMQMPKIEKVVDKIYGEIQETGSKDAPETKNEGPEDASKWVCTEDLFTTDGKKKRRIECPRCGFSATFLDGCIEQYKYCPQCGVHMTGIALEKKREKDINSQTSADASSPDYKDWHHYECHRKLEELEEMERMLSNEIKKDGYQQC